MAEGGTFYSGIFFSQKVLYKCSIIILGTGRQGSMVLKNRATTTSQCVAMHHATSNALIAALAGKQLQMDCYPIHFSHNYVLMAKLPVLDFVG